MLTTKLPTSAASGNSGQMVASTPFKELLSLPTPPFIPLAPPSSPPGLGYNDFGCVRSISFCSLVFLILCCNWLRKKKHDFAEEQALLPSPVRQELREPWLIGIYDAIELDPTTWGLALVFFFFF